MASLGVSAKVRALRGRWPAFKSQVVAEVYATSSGNVPDHLDAFECTECGQVYYGRDRAERCCSED